MSPLRRLLAAAAVAVASLAPAGASAHATDRLPAVTRPATPGNLRPALLGNAQQVLIVSSTRWGATTASASLWQRSGTTWRRIAGPWNARVGRRGISTKHREGSGDTPAGSFAITGAMGISTRSGTRIPYTRIASDSCWISDSKLASYNRLVRKSPCSAPNENLYRIAKAGPYRRFFITDFNMTRTVAGAGSAIFVHIHGYTASGRTKPTSGCVSLTSRQIDRLWSLLDPALHPRVIIGTTSWLVG